MVPDVAADANPTTGIAVYQAGIPSRAFGTSASAPIWAGILALAAPTNTTSQQVLTALYALTLTPTAYQASFNDIQVGINGNCGAQCQANQGYDLLSGLGSPQGNALIPTLAAMLGAPFPTPTNTFTPIPTPTDLPATATVKALTATPTDLPATATVKALTATPTDLPATATVKALTATPTDLPATATVKALTATPTDLPATATVKALTATPTDLPATATVKALTATATPTIPPGTQTAIVQTATIQALTATATPTIHPGTQTAVVQTATVQALTATATPTIHPLTLTSVALTPTSTPPTSSGQAGVPCTGRIGGVCTASGGVTGTLTKTGSMTFSLTATGPPNAAVGRSPTVFIPTTRSVETATCALALTGAQTTCTGTTVGDALQNAVVTVRFTLVTGATVDVAGVVAGPGPQVTPTATALTVAQAAALVAPSGQAGVPAASQVGQSVQVSGQVRGTGQVTGSMAWTLAATVPAGVAAGTLPVAVFDTTLGLQGFACAVVGAGAGTVTCNGTTAGNALQGSTVTVVFAAGIVATGTVSGPGVLPLLPPLPPLLLPPLPPPPPPLVPAVPLAPAGGAPAAAEVPVIPESDSWVLLAVGLAGLAALALRRRARTR
jgi:hypothetical protein